MKKAFISVLLTLSLFLKASTVAAGTAGITFCDPNSRDYFCLYGGNCKVNWRETPHEPCECPDWASGSSCQSLDDDLPQNVPQDDVFDDRDDDSEYGYDAYDDLDDDPGNGYGGYDDLDDDSDYGYGTIGDRDDDSEYGYGNFDDLDDDSEYDLDDDSEYGAFDDRDDDSEYSYGSFDDLDDDSEYDLDDDTEYDHGAFDDRDDDSENGYGNFDDLDDDSEYGYDANYDADQNPRPVLFCDESFDSFCLNEGTCGPTLDAPCFCSLHFSGEWCEIPMDREAESTVHAEFCDEFEETYCLNGGTCKPNWRQSPDQPCECVGHFGSSCEFPNGVKRSMPAGIYDIENNTRALVFTVAVFLASAFVLLACCLRQRAILWKKKNQDIVLNLQSFRDDEPKGKSANGNMLFPGHKATPYSDQPEHAGAKLNSQGTWV